MTLDQVYNKYQGQSVSFDGIPANRGQCVQWVEFVHTEAYGHPPHYADARFWYEDPKELLQWYDKIPVGTPPKKGDIVVWSGAIGGGYGHIDVCMQNGTASGFLGADSNWGGDKTVHLVQHNYSNVLGYLRPKGDEVIDEEGANIIADTLNYTPGQGASMPFKASAIGKTYKQFLVEFQGGQQFAEQKAKLNAPSKYKPVTKQLFEEG